MSWETRAGNNLLPLSRDKDSLSRALREWRYTGDYHDLEEPSANCELCDHPDIRYQFEIRNLNTAETLLIGSECIHRFGIPATDEEGRALDALATRKKVDRDRRQLVEDARRRRLVTALVALANVERDFDVHSFIDYLQTRGAFTPKQLATVLWRLKKQGVAHSPQDFKLTIRRGREKAQLLSLKEWEMVLVRPCLTSEQSAYLEKVAHRRASLDHLLD
ncbi:hypothetical protein [Mesorhizobium sp. ES1-6]|uniref:hypothetical protein n=1 Tax=Mesorhizobium sp. ES1-6 TaxID=2876626 RepID=UPI001CCC03C1|nr:hypothetical protein [Mesorhizobium sp. ES1-6]MBZ9806126.1 hypothetical protein [Mesorhizobium sp. ES1-6]